MERLRIKNDKFLGKYSKEDMFMLLPESWDCEYLINLLMAGHWGNDTFNLIFDSFLLQFSKFYIIPLNINFPLRESLSLKKFQCLILVEASLHEFIDLGHD